MANIENRVGPISEGNGGGIPIVALVHSYNFKNIEA